MRFAKILMALGLCAFAIAAQAGDNNPYVAKAGHPSLQEWLLPDMPPAAVDNAPTPARVELGKVLFFDPRISGDGNMSCASCHNPSLGWSDGLPTAKGYKSAVLARATPSIVNAGFNALQMWDGRKTSLEDQAIGPPSNPMEMHTDISAMLDWLNGNAEYKALFAKAYPGKAIDAETFSKAIAAFESTIVSNDSPFDRWVKGDKKAMTPQQVEGFKLFVGKANCVACHAAPNFTDDGYHNLGLASYGAKDPDMGRYVQKPLASLKGAFKTPSLRDVNRTAPYFHDGSASTLMAVVEHYNRGGVVKTDLSRNIKALGLSKAEKEALVAFQNALTSPYRAISLPELPKP